MLSSTVKQAALACRNVTRACNVFSRHLSTKEDPAPAVAKQPEISYRCLRGDDLQAVYREWIIMGVDLGQDHMNSFSQHLVPDNYIGGVVNGTLLGYCANINLNDSLAVKGGLLVSPDARGLGLGSKMYHAGNDVFGERSAHADAVLEMADKYILWGLSTKGYFNIAYSGHLRRYPFCDTETESPKLDPSYRLVPDSSIDFRDIMKFDRTVHPDSSRRTGYLKWYLDNESTVGYAIINADGDVVGYGAKSKLSGEDQFIGPVYAGNSEHAHVLMRTLVAEIPDGAFVRIMAPQDNETATSMIQQLGLEQDDIALRLATGKIHPFPLSDIYGHTLAGFAGYLPC